MLLLLLTAFEPRFDVNDDDIITVVAAAAVTAGNDDDNNADLEWPATANGDDACAECEEEDDVADDEEDDERVFFVCLFVLFFLERFLEFQWFLTALSVLPVPRSFAIWVHFVPYTFTSLNSKDSSSADHSVMLMEGSNLFVQRSLHCFADLLHPRLSLHCLHFAGPFFFTWLHIISSSSLVYCCLDLMLGMIVVLVLVLLMLVSSDADVEIGIWPDVGTATTAADDDDDDDEAFIIDA